jgi:hypothetical protein
MTMIFTYLIVPEGGDAGQALARGSLYTSDIETAKRHARAGFAPGVEAQPGLEVILLDDQGRDIWRGSYWGARSKSRRGSIAGREEFQ